MSSLFGLQVRLEGIPESMFALVFDQETIMLDETAVYGCSVSRQTGWTFELKDGEPRVCAANETHAKKTKICPDHTPPIKNRVSTALPSYELGDPGMGA